MDLCEAARWHPRPDKATRTAVVQCNEMVHGDEISVAVSTPARCRLCRMNRHVNPYAAGFVCLFVVSSGGKESSNRTREITTRLQDCWDLRRPDLERENDAPA